MTPRQPIRPCTSAEDILHALRGTSQRLDYGELLDALRKQDAPVAGVAALLERMMREGRVRCTDRGNNPWFWYYKDEDFDDGPMYIEEA